MTLDLIRFGFILMALIFFCAFWVIAILFRRVMALEIALLDRDVTVSDNLLEPFEHVGLSDNLVSDGAISPVVEAPQAREAQG